MNTDPIIDDAMNGVHDDRGTLDHLASLDLNLLVAFEILVRERSVTRSADRMGVTQSAMSHTLRRLRHALGDPILVRGQGGMVLTARAQDLAVPIRSGLLCLERALSEPAVFDPSDSQRRFRMASPDLFDLLMLPPLLARVRALAPCVDITIVPSSDSRLAESLESGEVDMAVLALPQMESRAELPNLAAPGLIRQTLFRDRFLCFLRDQHPGLHPNGRLSLDEYTKLNHVLVSPSGSGPGLVDRALQERGLSRRIALRIPSFGTAPRIIAQSDLVLTAPSSLAQILVGNLEIVSAEPPLSLPEHTVNLVWHQRFSNDPGHRWLRERIEETTAKRA